jgi:hypothetical protein
MTQTNEEKDDKSGLSPTMKIRGTSRTCRAFRALMLLALCMLSSSSLVHHIIAINPFQGFLKSAGTFMVANDGRRASQQELDGNNSFSACLLWMDDNARLTEWLAYHYHVLPLRYLVILVDKGSSTSPNVEKWRNLMTIVQWNYTDDEILLETSKNDLERYGNYTGSFKYSFDRYMHTQRDFYRKCAFHMKSHNRTWTAWIDTDEFVVLDSRLVKNVTQRLQQPGAALTLIQEAHALNQTHGQSQFEHNCMVMARREIGAVESPPEYVAKDVPPNMVDLAMRFQTLRFRHQKDKGIIGKSLMDVTKFDNSELTNTPYSAHRIIPKCGDNPWGGRGVQLIVNHYVGSWEVYQRPNDFRNVGEQRRDVWITKANVSSQWGTASVVGGEIRPWLQGFVAYFGEAKSRYLLDNLGVPYNTSTALHVL